MATWGIQLDFGFIEIGKLTPGDWAQINQIKKDIIETEKIKSQDEALICAFIAFLHIKSVVEENKRELNQELH